MFIKSNSIKVGYCVELMNDVKVMAGTFTKGHIFFVTGIGQRGYDLVDSDGNRLIESWGKFSIVGQGETNVY